MLGRPEEAMLSPGTRNHRRLARWLAEWLDGGCSVAQTHCPIRPFSRADGQDGQHGTAARGLDERLRRQVLEGAFGSAGYPVYFAGRRLSG